MKKNEVKKNNKGFSLVELIVVIAIMAVLVGVLAPQFIKYVEKSRISTDIQNLEQIKTAIEVYTAENPVTAGTTLFSGDQSTASSQTITAATALQPALTDAGLKTSVTFKSKNWKEVNITVTATGVEVKGYADYSNKRYSVDGTVGAIPAGSGS